MESDQSWRGWALVKMGPLGMEPQRPREQRMDAARSPALVHGEGATYGPGVDFCHLLGEAELAGSCSIRPLFPWAIHTGHPSRRTVGHSLCLVQEMPISTVTDPSMRRALWIASEGPPLSRVSWTSSPGGCKNLQVWVLVETCLRKLQLQLAMSDPDVMAAAKAK